MQQFELSAERRSETGKGASRRLRRAGKLPGVIYGAGKGAQSLTLDHNAIAHQLENEAFYSHILTINVGDGHEKVVLKDLQRHPYKPSLLHIDFQRIDEKEKLTLRVPLHFINEDQCIGVKQSGGVISHIMTELEVNCLPKDLPEYIDVDLLQTDVGESIHLADLILPEGVTIHALTHGGDASLPVVAVNLPRVVEEAAAPAAIDEGEAAADAAADTGTKS